MFIIKADYYEKKINFGGNPNPGIVIVRGLYTGKINEKWTEP